MGKLTGKTAVVTGGAKGIGKAICLKLASLGANIVVNYSKSKGKVEEVIKEIESMGTKAIAVQCDVSKFEECKMLASEALNSFGSIDILVNNAGITKDNLLLRMKEEDFDSVIEVNLKGAFNCVKHITPIMLKQKSGKIINISSVVGIIGNPGQINYVSSKAGLIGMTKALAKEVGSRGINVNAVAPGFIDTEMTEILSDKIKESLINSIPLKRAGKAEDVAEVVAFLSTSQSDYVTGQVINCDGGMVM